MNVCSPVHEPGMQELPYSAHPCSGVGGTGGTWRTCGTVDTHRILGQLTSGECAPGHPRITTIAAPMLANSGHLPKGSLPTACFSGDLIMRGQNHELQGHFCTNVRVPGVPAMTIATWQSFLLWNLLYVVGGVRPTCPCFPRDLYVSTL